MLCRDDWLVIGISGVTCGGKTTLANRLLAALAGARALHQDAYFLPAADTRHTPAPGLALPHHNYDILSALDMPQMYSDAIAIIEGKDKTEAEGASGVAGGAVGGAVGGTGGAAGGGARLTDRRVLILEGFTVLNYKPLYDLCDLRYYMILEYGECLSRRALRLYEPPDVPGYFDSVVWPEHLRYRAQLDRDPRVCLLDGGEPGVMDLVMEGVRQWAAQHK